MQVTEVFQFLARIVVLPIIPQKNCLLRLSSEAPSVALLIISSFFHCSVFKVQAPVKDRIKTLKHV